MKKTPRPEAVRRYVRLYGATSIVVAEEAKKDAMMEEFVRNFRALYTGDGAKEMAKARDRASRTPIETD